METNKIRNLILFSGSGSTPSRKENTYWNSRDIPWLKTDQIGDYKIYNTKEYVSKKAFDECSLKIYPAGAISMAMYGEGKTRGSVSILAAPMATNQACFTFVIDEEKINSKYVYYYLLNQYDNLRQLSSGVRKNLNADIIKNVEISYPKSRCQQDAIANVLGSIDDKMLANRKIITTLESMAKTLYDYWFVQFDFPDANGNPYKTSGGKMEWNETLSREIPAGWEVSKLSQYISSSRGISYSTKTLGDAGIPMVNLASFGPYGTYKESGIKRYVGKYTSEDIVKPYELIMCNTQQTAIKFETDIIGHAFLMPDIYEGDVVSSHHMTHIHVDNESLKYYLARLFNTNYFHKYISGHTNGTNILGLLFSGVEDYTDVIPKQSVLDAFAIRMKSIEQEKSRVIKENDKLISLRQFMLPLLMNGQVTFRQ